MEKWKYKSLEWIHKVREEDFNESKNLTPKELIEKTRKSTESAIKKMRLKVIKPKEHVR